jgi:hypothetical protein
MRPLLLLAAALLLPATLAAADPAPAPDSHQMATSDCARARKAGKTCVLTIESETVDGGAPTAGESAATAITFARAGSLIRIRKDFIQEILRTAEDL